MKKFTLFFICVLMSLLVSAQDYSQVYIIGDATPKSWDLGNADEMMQITLNEDDAIYAWTGQMTTGRFKFMNTKADWKPSFVANGEHKQVEMFQSYDLVFLDEYANSNESDPGYNDFQFEIQTAGRYTVVVNIKKLTIKILPGELKLIGGAVNGWGAINELAENMYQSAYDTYTWTGKMTKEATGSDQTPGFKILIGDSYAPCFNAETEDLSLVAGNTYNILYNDMADNKFVPSEDAYYTVTINLSDLTMKVDYVSLYMIGGATTAGWAIENVIAFTRDASDPNKFVYDGTLQLNADENTPERDMFKIMGQQGWNPFSLHPDTNGEDILSETITINKNFNGSFADNKWKIQGDKEGKYTITVDLMNQTINAVYKEITTDIEKANIEDNYKIITTNGNVELFLSDSFASGDVQLIDIAGKVVGAQANVGNYVVLGGNLQQGIYLVKISCGEKSTIQKVLVK
ncbi:SusF/SusE family outer membrane protein [Dysgonomonas sp. 520]|uniref:SusF/SusE family outer membrane protein n=1 Tax=Dysgonomonas sp. 520 TaxID=2302931 RepID=UPI0013D50163|nr:SusF/SusE family outer membrane protein [Dysgonomonas sp. 520]NDW11046.1 SusF/SusE family outer membrane protein [Dysgonomonas sp. 520]